MTTDFGSVAVATSDEAPEPSATDTGLHGGPFRQRTRPHPAAPAPVAKRPTKQRASPEAATLRARYAHIAHIVTRTRLDFGTAAVRFVGAQGPRWIGHSSLRDYVRGRLGIPWSTFQTYKRVGQLILDYPDLQAAALQQGVCFSTLDTLARAGTGSSLRQAGASSGLFQADVGSDMARYLPLMAGRTVKEVRQLVGELFSEGDRESAGAESGDSSADTGGLLADCEHPTSMPTDATIYKRVSFRVPPSVAVYVEETLDLAQSLLGHDAGEDQQVAAVVAEASTEIEITIPPTEALARLHLLSLREMQNPDPTFTPALGHRSYSVRSGSDRRAALVLDRYLMRQARRLLETDVRMEDELLRAFEEYEKHRCGFATFAEFSREVLNVAPRTAWDRIRRARLRRNEAPIAVARAQGRITAVKADLLQRLQKLHIPEESLEAWIQCAQEVTTRRLRQCVTWARVQVYRGNEDWRRGGSPPPTDEQVRTSNRPLDEIATDYDVPDLAAAVAAPQVAVHWTLSAETLIDLAQLMTSLCEVHSNRTGTRPPTWWALLAVFWHARKAWAPLSAANREHRQRRRILERDRYHCMFPDCSLRQGMEVHHIVYRGQQGSDDDENRVTLCGFHHRLGEHQRTVRIRGKATEGGDRMRWELGLDLQGRPRLVYQGERLVLDSLHRPRSTTATVM